MINLTPELEKKSSFNVEMSIDIDIDTGFKKIDIDIEPQCQNVENSCGLKRENHPNLAFLLAARQTNHRWPLVKQ